MVSRSTRVSPLVMLLGAVFFLSTHVFGASAVLGIDFGTEYIKAALVKPGIPLDIVLTKDSRRKETSAVAFKPSNGGPQDGQYPERLYGADAMALSARFPGDVYPNLKTLLGLPIDDPVVKEYAARHPGLQLQAHETRGTAAFKSKAVTVEEEAWAVEELLAMELQSVQKNAEAAAGDGTSVRSAVLTVPPFYTTEEKRAVESAAELAGFKVLSLISDGLAVGLNYATSRQFPNTNEGTKPEYHMVFDMGAGSTKASVMKFQSRNTKDVGKFNKTVQEVQLIGSGWDRTLGGDILNDLIVDNMISQFVESKEAKKVSATIEGIKTHGRAMAKLTKEAEKVRHVLSANQNTQASFEGLYEDVDFKYKVTRAGFEDMVEAHAGRLGVVINDALKMAGLDITDLGSVILHGGASRTPFVQKTLEKFVGSSEKLRTNVNSDEAAVFGAGFRAAELSPSFRVKEIKISEGSSYPVGMKWATSDGKDHVQRLWSPISPLGGAPKEFTFTEQDDFTAKFYQQVSADYKDLMSITTKNLTSTVASLKEKYPSCAESGVYFRVGATLSSENGEVEIVKAAVECEAEVKDGFVDGVKNLFGFGKKDQEPLNQAEDGSETETVVVDEASSDNAEASTASNSESTEAAATEAAEAETSGSSEEIKDEAKKLEIVSIPVDYVVAKLGIPELSKEQVAKSVDRLKAFAVSDKARMLREEALNQLEGYTYRVRDLVDDERFIGVSVEAERTKLAEKSSEISEWLYDDGSEASKDQLKAKLKELQDLADPIQKRVGEAEKRPELVTKLKDALNQTEVFIGTMRKQIDEYEAWHASASASASASGTTETPENEFGDLEDDTATEKTMEDVLEERGPIPPLYKREDLDQLDGLFKSTQTWLKDLETKQDALPPTADPVLLVSDLNSKRVKLEQAGKDLALKGARNFDGKRKKGKKDKKTNSDGSKTASADPSKQTIKVGDKVFSTEELEDMVNNMNEDDWQQVEEELEKKKADQQQQTHDEL